MESDARSEAAKGSISQSPESKSQCKQQAEGDSFALVSSHHHLNQMIHTGGQLLIGAIKPLKRTAVAYDGTKTVAMLKFKANDTLEEVLIRLDAAVAKAQKENLTVDEINRPGANKTYKY